MEACYFYKFDLKIINHHEEGISGMKLELRLHGRGGQGIKTAGRIVGTAAFYEGYYVQDSPMYGPERRGAHVSSFVRISDEQVEGRGYIFHPDAVIIADPSLLEMQPSPLQGLKQGGAIIINTAGEPATLKDYRVAVYDISSLASRIVGRRGAISAGVGAFACKALGIAGLESVLEAVKDEMHELDLREELVEANIRLAEEIYRDAPTVEIETTPWGEASATSKIVEIPYLEPEVSTSMILMLGNSKIRRTGAWRASTPVIDYSKCTRCMICFVYCPDACISLDNNLTPRIDYDNCKGCLICYIECPIKAIKVEGGEEM